MSYYPPYAIKTKNESTLDKVAKMVSDPNAIRYAKEHGLDIMNIAWEDCARYKNSCWGPCISDMTLVVQNTWMPVIRVPNFSDPIMSIPSSKITLTVGNQSPNQSTPLQKISLQEYLETIDQYTELENPMYVPDRDHQAVVSTQTCFLPIEDDMVDFHVGLYNYQSTDVNPTVLVLVCNEAGTSAQIIGSSTSTLYANDHGTKHTFVAERLSRDRAARGVVESSKEMTQEEEARNYIMIIQIPIRRPVQNMYQGRQLRCQYVEENSDSDYESDSDESDGDDVEDAMVSLGEAKGPFPTFHQHRNVQRNPDFPIRVTIQFYKATSNGVISENTMQNIAHKMDQVKENATWWGSLVTNE
ncbi:hypothetical protein THRCLA_20842 [Thraustotheca clavata]|uniref:Uncharacterized protein n=1 Tax=Thraustotheca clavata TaxID=74557 RepID=A0A1W0A333_9STRA|nr:hypothetical protein THRCLA_20842 [Thraustotheca clavata]